MRIKKIQEFQEIQKEDKMKERKKIRSAYLSSCLGDIEGNYSGGCLPSNPT